MNIIKQLARAMAPEPPSTASSEAALAAWMSMLSPTFRLAPYVVPLHYALEFQPNTTLNTFAGAVYITLTIAEAPPAPLNHLVVHALELTLDVGAVYVLIPADPQSARSGPHVHPSHQRTATAGCAELEGTRVPCVNSRYSEASETLQLLFDTTLPSAVGDVFVLCIERFDGCISTGSDMEGLMHSSPTNPAVISTHLEPTHARRVFPCFDEPAIQATFQLSVVTDSSLAVVSNTEVEADVALTALPYCVKTSRSAEHRESGSTVAAGNTAGPLSEDPAWSSGCFTRSSSSAAASLSSSYSSASGRLAAAPAASQWHCVRFTPTPPMHTCIIGFHVGRFNILEQRSRLSRVLCRVVLPHTEPNSSGWFALDLVTKALDFFEEFFGVRLPLKKLDLVAMEKFAVLGMENWGMINLHKDYLIVTGTTPLERRQRITRLIGHETCHQWFGNWISIEWWNCLWLKEGMCRYLEYFFVNAIFPSWGLWNEFLSVIMNDALLADADPYQTHPVDCCNSAPRRIYDSFDTISYGKGACVLRMMFSIIGTEWLKRATHLLMTRYANKSFNAKDLGDCIVATADVRSSTEAQVQHAKAISYALQMVGVVSHPYLYIQQFPGEGYNITQYVPPSKQHGLLVEYVQSQRGKAGAPVIDLFSNPAHLSFEWKPEETLTRVEAPFSVPLRAARWHRGGHGSVRLIFIEDIEHFMPLPAAASPSSTTPGFGGSSGGGVVVSPATQTRSFEPTSPTSTLQQVCYFDHGGGGFYQCDYDAATWRQLFDFVAAFSDEDRMIITLHFINTAKAQLGHQPDTTGDRCTLFFEWLLCLTSTPGAMNSYLWDIVTRALTHVVQLVQQYYCQSVVKAFVNGLYQPLQKRCVLSFFAQEKTVSFQSSIHLSRHLVLNILQLLCLCENPEVVDEAVETAQWALCKVLPAADSPYHPNAAGGSGSAAVSGGATATAAPLSADTCTPRSSGSRSNAPSPLATAPLGAPARRASQPDLSSSSSNLGASSAHPTPLSAAAAAPKSSPMKVVPAAGHLLTNSFSGSAARALPLPQLASSTPHHAEHGSCSNLLNSFCGPSSATDWATVKNNSIASYPYQRAAELNLADPSHVKAGEVALGHLATLGRMDHWMAAAAVAAEVLELDRDVLYCHSGLAVPAVRLTGLDRGSREMYLRLVLPAVFSLDREALFPFMAKVFQALTFLSAPIVEALYRNSRFLSHLISAGFLANRRVLNFVLQCGAEVCSNGYVIAQLKVLAHGASSRNDSVSSSVEMFKGVEFADGGGAGGAGSCCVAATSSATTSPPTSVCTSASTSAATSTERSTLRLQSPAVAQALDMMEANCVWMDYCCWHYDGFFRDQRQKQVWRPTRSEANSSMHMSAPAGEEADDGQESFGGVSI